MGLLIAAVALLATGLMAGAVALTALGVLACALNSVLLVTAKFTNEVIYTTVPVDHRTRDEKIIEWLMADLPSYEVPFKCAVSASGLPRTYLVALGEFQRGRIDAEEFNRRAAIVDGYCIHPTDQIEVVTDGLDTYDFCMVCGERPRRLKEGSKRDAVSFYEIRAAMDAIDAKKNRQVAILDAGMTLTKLPLTDDPQGHMILSTDRVTAP